MRGQRGGGKRRSIDPPVHVPQPLLFEFFLSVALTDTTIMTESGEGGRGRQKREGKEGR